MHNVFTLNEWEINLHACEIFTAFVLVANTAKDGNKFIKLDHSKTYNKRRLLLTVIDKRLNVNIYVKEQSNCRNSEH